MSYGNIYILSEISKLKAHGFNKQRVINLIANRINSRYPEISITRGKVIAKKLYEGQLPSQADWKMGERVKLVEDDYPLVKPRTKEKKVRSLRVISHYSPTVSSSIEDGTVIVLFKGKQRLQNVFWKDLGNDEGYPYIIINKVEYGLEEG